MASTAPRHPSHPHVNGKPPGKLLHPPKRAGGPVSFKAPKGTRVSFHPRNLSPAFDVVAELVQNRDLYSGGEWFSLCAFPRSLRTSLDRIRARVPARPNGQRPGLSPAIACCIANGVAVIGEHDDVKQLAGVKGEFDKLGNVDAGDVDEIAVWFTSFPLGISDATQTGVRRQNITLPESIRGDLNVLADQLGASQSSLATLATMVTLATQESVLEGHHTHLTEAVTTFFRRVHRRRTIAEVLLETLRAEGEEG